MAARSGASSAKSDFHAEDVLDKPFDRALAMRLLRYVLPYKKRLFVALFLIASSSALALLGPVMMKEAIDGPLAGTVTTGSNLLAPIVSWVDGFGLDDTGKRRALLAVICCCYALLLIVQFITRFQQWIIMNETGQRIMRDLRMQVFGHLQKQSLHFFQKQPIGRLVTRVTSDVEALNELLSSGVVTFFGDLISLFGIVLLLFYFNTQLALVALSVVPFLLAITILFRTMARRHYRENRRRIAHLNAFTQESISGIDIVQISCREEAQARRYEEINEGYLHSWLGSIFWFSIFFPAVEILSAISMALVVTYSGEQITIGAATLGEFFLFWNCLTKFFMPIRDLAEKYNVLQAAMASAERIFGVLDVDTRLPEHSEPQSARPVVDAIRFEHVGFAYDPEKSVLQDVSFDVKRGETVALVGATGAGKSTIVNLLMRFYDPTEGRITIDGRDIRELSTPEHRARIGLVLQDVSVFSRSVGDNLDLDRGLTPERLRPRSFMISSRPPSRRSSTSSACTSRAAARNRSGVSPRSRSRLSPTERE
ncbi:MAG: ABC transporter transmembrane domain-containing protein, partial [Planctomycetota bacterium]